MGILRTIEYWIMDDTAELDIKHALILAWGRTRSEAIKMAQEYPKSVVVMVSYSGKKTNMSIVWRRPCQN